MSRVTSRNEEVTDYRAKNYKNQGNIYLQRLVLIAIVNITTKPFEEREIAIAR